MSLERLMFFFGAGVSFPSGLPGARELTQRLTSKSWFRHTDDRYYEGPSMAGWEGIDYGRVAQELVRNLLRREDRYRASRKAPPTNYEDVFSLLDRLISESTGQRYSLDSGTLLRSLESRWLKKHNEGLKYPWTDNPYASALQHAQYLIQGVIRTELGRNVPVVGFDLLKSCRDCGLAGRYDFATLNHDLLLERFLSSIELPVADGFADIRGDAAFYSEESLRVALGSRLMKLHGSIDWYLLRDDGKDDDATLFEGIAKTPGDSWHCRTPGGWVYSPLKGEPEVVTGTHSKEAAYSDGIFRSQMLVFEETLRQTERVVCCGYSWRDSGINVRFRTWLKSNPATRLIVLHKNVPELEATPGWRWFDWYDDLIKKSRVVIVPKWLCETTLADITPHLN